MPFVQSTGQGIPFCSNFGLISCQPVTSSDGNIIPTFPKLLPVEQRFNSPTLPEGITQYICRKPDCSSVPCLNDGTCFETIEGYNCTCKTTYHGKQCEKQDRFITSLRLFGGNSSSEGRVAFTAINDVNQTQYFLRHSWTMEAAHLVCRYLGYSGAFAIVSGDLYQSQDPINQSVLNQSQYGEIACPPDPQYISECWYNTASDEQDTSLMWNAAVICCTPQVCGPIGERLLPNIPDSAINQSSCWAGWDPDTVCGWAGRIDSPTTAWVPGHPPIDQWVLIHLGEEDYIISGILTQGKRGKKQWVTSYYISYTKNGTWMTYTNIYNDTLVKIFPGNYDDNSHVMNLVQPPIVARYVRIHPMTWEHSPCMRFDIVGVKSLMDQPDDETNGCVPLHGEKLGVEDGRIANESITASSLADPDQGASYARLNLDAIPDVTPGAWLPNATEQNPWIKIDLMTNHVVTGVITQGRGHPSYPHWTTSFTLSFSADDITWQEWEECGVTRVFMGNYDRSSPVTSLLNQPVTTRLVRIHPRTYAPRGVIALRCEILGSSM
ncbi:coagulation factor VIII-like [Lytechinus variegatus]|uniref:coagulation factor VIII-like n=1 Tax=Lytechinus variegatus TaxID=7654 RepID=UPI001BB20277|nr:coagulation factor VIII-like [Lytechinus variegatus]